MSRLLARAIMASPAGRLVRFLAGSPPPEPRTLEQRIADGADELRARGWSPMAALAGAEAVETGREHGFAFDRVAYSEEELRWYGVYEGAGGWLYVPLPHATEAMQRGTAVLN